MLKHIKVGKVCLKSSYIVLNQHHESSWICPNHRESWESSKTVSETHYSQAAISWTSIFGTCRSTVWITVCGTSTIFSLGNVTKSVGLAAKGMVVDCWCLQSHSYTSDSPFFVGYTFMGCTSAPGSEAHLLPNVNLVNLWMLNDSLLKLDLTASRLLGMVKTSETTLPTLW